MRAEAPPERTSLLTDRAGHVELLDPGTILALRDGLTLEMRESLLEAFQNAVPECVAKILSAVIRGEQQELKRAAHLLKGSAATLGATRLKAACQRLELSAPDSKHELDELTPIVRQSIAALRRYLLRP